MAKEGLKSKKAYVEGYGCSLSKSETAQIITYLRSKGFSICKEPWQGSIIIVNACGVKEATEKRMLSRLEKLNKIAEKNGSKLIAFGCLSKISPSKIRKISEKIIVVGPCLEELAEILNFEKESFCPLLAAEASSDYVGIIPIAKGCLGNCSYCAVKNARGKLRSYSIEEICESIRRQLPFRKEFWLTAQDTGCYGFDNETDLAELLREILKIDGKFRIRIGMMNPKHAKQIIGKLLPLFKDERLYRFLHLPLQSGSDEILLKMKRGYSANDFLEIVEKIRSCYDEFTIATDVIVGFPGESENDFIQTIKVIEKARPCTINISRYGSRPNTEAAKMKQLDSKIKKERSRILSALSLELSSRELKSREGLEEEAYFSEKGKGKSFVGRTISYKPVVVKENLLGKFARIKVQEACRTYLKGVPLPSE